MKKIVLSLSLIGAAYANEMPEETCWCPEPTVHSSFGYLSAGLGPLPIPGITVGAGRRIVTGDETAVDFGVDASTFLFVSSVKGYANNLWYFNQKPCSQWYLGLGGSLGCLVPIGYCGARFEGFAAPNIVLGREFLTKKGNKRFIQIETMYPIFLFHEFVNYPAVTIKCGFAF